MLDYERVHHAPYCNRTASKGCPLQKDHVDNYSILGDFENISPTSKFQSCHVGANIPVVKPVFEDKYDLLKLVLSIPSPMP